VRILRNARPAAALWGSILFLAGAVPCRGATLTLPAGAGAPPGAATSVALHIDDASGILGVFIQIAYDPSVALATGLTTTPLSSGQSLTVNLSPPGTIRISLFGTAPLGGGGDLLSIAFNSVGPLDSTTILDLQFAELNEGEIPATLVDGHYCVQNAVAEVRALSLGPGAGGTAMVWAPDPAALFYNLYRGERADLSDLVCLLGGIPDPQAIDPLEPPPAGLQVYLVTAVNCRGESSLGSGAPPAARPVPPRCP